MVGEDVDVLVDDATVSVDAVETTVDATDAVVDKPERGRKRVVAIIAAVCAMVLVAAGAGGWVAWSKHELHVAKADCDSAAVSVKSVRAEYAKLVAGDDVKTASAVTVEQVKYAKTVETLAAAVKAGEPKSVACPVQDVKSLKETTSKLNTQTDWYKTHKMILQRNLMLLYQQ